MDADSARVDPLPGDADPPTPHDRERDGEHHGAVLLVATMAAILAIGLLVDSVTSTIHTHRTVLAGAPVAVPSPGAHDDFARADSLASLGRAESGQRWSTQGVWGITGGAAVVVKPAGSATLATVPIGESAGHIEVTAAVIAPGFGLAFRCRGPLNCWRIEAVPKLGTWNVIKVVQGKEHDLGNLATVPVANGTTIAVDLAGTRITIRVNGTVVRRMTDADLAHETRAGLSLREPFGARVARWMGFRAAPIPGPSVVARGTGSWHDAFARADAPTLGSTPAGAQWHAVAGSFAIRDTRAVVLTPASAGPSLALVDTGASDGVVEATLWRPQQEAGIAFRCRDAANCWRLEVALGYGSWTLSKIVDGRVERVGQLQLVSVDPATTVSVRLDGNRIRVYVNARLAGTWHDSFLQHDRHAGLVVEHHPFSNSTEWSAFRVGRAVTQ